MSDRFFIAAAPLHGRAVLSGDEARHLAKVLRARVGDTVVLFDGHGREWTATVARMDRDRIDLHAGPERNEPPTRRPRLTLAVALPKGDRQKWLVEKLTELGVHSLVPLETTRGVAEATDAARSRLERVVIEACKQCGRNTLMTIESSRGLGDLVAGVAAGTRLLLADPGGQPWATDGRTSPPEETLALVGPEGGFTAEEVAAVVAAGAARIRLGPHVLRVETAAVALAAHFAT